MGAVCFKGAEEAARGTTAAAAAGFESGRASANDVAAQRGQQSLRARLATAVLKDKQKHSRGLALVESQELPVLLAGLQNPAVVLCISRQPAPDTAFDTATSLLTSTGRERFTERPRVVLDGPCGQPFLALPLHFDSSAALTCLATNTAAEAGMQLCNDQDVLGLLAAQCLRDPSLQALLRDVVKRLLLGGRCSAVSHLAPTWGGGDVACATSAAADATRSASAAGGVGGAATTQEQHFQSVRITPFMCRLASSAVGGMPEPTSPNVADASERTAVAYAAAISGAAAAQPLGGASTTLVVNASASSLVVPALILELGVPYEGKDLASRLQRDYMILSNIPSIVTMFDLSGRVLHQNRSSIQYLGYLAGMDQTDDGEEDGGGVAVASAGRGEGDLGPSGHGGMDVRGGAGISSQEAAAADAAAVQRNWLQKLFVLDAGRLQELMQAVAAGSEWRGLVQMPHGSFWQQCDMLPQQQPHTPRQQQHQRQQHQPQHAWTQQEPFPRAILGAGTSTSDLAAGGVYRVGLSGRGARMSVDAGSNGGRAYVRSGTSHSDTALTRIMAAGVPAGGTAAFSPRPRAVTEPTQKAAEDAADRIAAAGMAWGGDGSSSRQQQQAEGAAPLRRVSQVLFGEGLVVTTRGLSASEQALHTGAATRQGAAAEAFLAAGSSSVSGAAKVSVSDWASNAVLALPVAAAPATEERSPMPSAFTHLAATMLPEYPNSGNACATPPAPAESQGAAAGEEPTGVGREGPAAPARDVLPVVQAHEHQVPTDPFDHGVRGVTVAPVTGGPPAVSQGAAATAGPVAAGAMPASEPPARVGPGGLLQRRQSSIARRGAGAGPSRFQAAAAAAVAGVRMRASSDDADGGQQQAVECRAVLPASSSPADPPPAGQPEHVGDTACAAAAASTAQPPPPPPPPATAGVPPGDAEADAAAAAAGDRGGLSGAAGVAGAAREASPGGQRRHSSTGGSAAQATPGMSGGNSSFQQWYTPDGTADAPGAVPSFSKYPPLPSLPPPPPLPAIQSASISSASPASARGAAPVVPASAAASARLRAQQTLLPHMSLLPSNAPSQQPSQHYGHSSFEPGSSLFSDLVPSLLMDRSSMDPGSEANTALFTNDITHDPALQRQLTHQHSHSYGSRARASMRSGPRSSRGSGSAFASPASTAVTTVGAPGASGRGGGYGAALWASPSASGSGRSGARTLPGAADEALASVMPPPSLAPSGEVSGSAGGKGLQARASSEDSGYKVTGGGPVGGAMAGSGGAMGGEVAPTGALAEAVRVVNSLAWGSLPPAGGVGAAGADAGALAAVGRGVLPAVMESPMDQRHREGRTDPYPRGPDETRPHQGQQQQQLDVLQQGLQSAGSIIGTPTAAGGTNASASTRAPPRARYTPPQQQFALMARGHPLSLASGNTHGGSISRRHDHAYGMEVEANGPESGNPDTLSGLATTTDVAFSIDLLANNAFPTAITATVSPATTVAANAIQLTAGSTAAQQHSAAPNANQLQSLQRTLSSEPELRMQIEAAVSYPTSPSPTAASQMEPRQQQAQEQHDATHGEGPSFREPGVGYQAGALPPREGLLGASAVSVGRSGPVREGGLSEEDQRPLAPPDAPVSEASLAPSAHVPLQPQQLQGTQRELLLQQRQQQESDSDVPLAALARLRIPRQAPLVPTADAVSRPSPLRARGARLVRASSAQVSVAMPCRSSSGGSSSGSATCPPALLLASRSDPLPAFGLGLVAKGGLSSMPLQVANAEQADGVTVGAAAAVDVAAPLRIAGSAEAGRAGNVAARREPEGGNGGDGPGPGADAATDASGAEVGPPTRAQAADAELTGTLPAPVAALVPTVASTPASSRQKLTSYIHASHAEDRRLRGLLAAYGSSGPAGRLGSPMTLACGGGGGGGISRAASAAPFSRTSLQMTLQHQQPMSPPGVAVPLPQSATAASAAWQQQQLQARQSVDGSQRGKSAVSRTVSEAAANGGYLPMLPIDVAAAAARERGAGAGAAQAAANPRPKSSQPTPLSPHPQASQLPSGPSVVSPYSAGAAFTGGTAGGRASHTGMVAPHGARGSMQRIPSTSMGRVLSAGHLGALATLATAPTGGAPPTSVCPSNPMPGSALVASYGESCRWFEVHAIPVPDPSTAGQQQGGTLIMVIQTDVTSKVQVEERLARVLEAEHRLLADIFPSHVVRHMTQRRRDEAELERKGMVLLKNIQDPAALATSHECITVLFADIKGFTDMSKEVPAATVMTFLNDLYTRFDSLTDVYGVYKVETIGDCYMVAGGLVARDEDGYGRAVRGQGDVDPLHAMRVLAFARAMLEEAASVALPTTGESVKMRVGIHSGPATSGVVGHKMPRFCLFGDTVNTASRMESTGRPGVIHVSAATRALLPPEEDEEGWAPTGGVDVKGRGRMDTYIWCTKAPGAERRQRTRYQRAQLLGTLSNLAPALSVAAASVGGGSMGSQGAGSPAVGGSALPAAPSVGVAGAAYGPSASALLSPRRATRLEDKASLMRTYTHMSAREEHA